MKKGYLLVDGNSVGHFHNNTKPLSIGGLQTQATSPGWCCWRAKPGLSWPFAAAATAWPGIA